jgi:hypothetical protein
MPSKEREIKVILGYKPVIAYASETWVLKESMKRKLPIEREILRRIFRPTKAKDGT